MTAEHENAMTEIDTALAANRDAVDQMIRAGEQSGSIRAITLSRWPRVNRPRWAMTAYGVNGSGMSVSQTIAFQLDGQEHTTPQPKTTMLARKLNARTIETIGKSDGQEVGRGTYVVSEDGKTLTATVSGADANHHTFKTVMVFERQ
jgi:hypothetical protein